MDLGLVAREGSYVEEEEGEVRYYCRSPLDGVRTGLAIVGMHEDAVTVYDGVHECREMIESDDRLLAEALSSPAVQMVMAVLGGMVVSVTAPGSGPDFSR